MSVFRTIVTRLLPKMNTYGGRVKTPSVFQMEATECGAACLAMILAYHGVHESLEKLRVACGVSRNGSVASLILKAARTYNMTAKGYALPLASLRTLQAPAILFWSFEHFVVFDGYDGRYYYVNDPAVGPLRYGEEEFEKHFTGIVLRFFPGENFVRHGRARGVFSTLFPLLGQVKEAVTFIVLTGMLLVLPGVLLPSMLRIFIDEVLSKKDDWLYPLLLATALTAVIQAILVYLEHIAFRRGELKLAVNNTLRMFRHMFALPMQFFAQRGSADLQHRIALNSTIAEAVFGSLAANATKLLSALFFLFLMFQFSVFLTCVVICSVVLNFVILLLCNRYRQVNSQALFSIDTRLLNLSMTGIAMMESLRAGGREEGFLNEWSSCLAEYAAKSHAMRYFDLLSSSLPALLLGLNNVLILCFGSARVIDGDLSLGSMMAFISLAGAFITPANEIVNAGPVLQELKGTTARVEDVFHYPAETRFRPSPSGEEIDHSLSCAPRGGAKLELRDITFGYSHMEKPIIENFSLCIEPGSSVALVGGSGSGKSTLAKLAVGLYAPWSGSILLNDRPMEEYTREEVTHMMAMVDQHVLLFSGSVRDNLTLFRRDADPGVLHTALRNAAMFDELAMRDAAMLTIPMDEAGSNFSGGQCQRLEIARALARNAPILILDEAMSALDAVTEYRIASNIRALGHTCLIVAHRLSTIRDCNKIVMLDSGKIQEEGTHQELMAKNGAYAHLVHTM